MAKWGGRIESPLYYAVTNCAAGFHCFVKKGFSLTYLSLQAHAGITGKYGISYSFVSSTLLAFADTRVGTCVH